jgi:hypothetical protein
VAVGVKPEPQMRFCQLALGWLLLGLSSAGPNLFLGMVANKLPAGWTWSVHCLGKHFGPLFRIGFFTLAIAILPMGLGALLRNLRLFHFLRCCGASPPLFTLRGLKSFNPSISERYPERAQREPPRFVRYDQRHEGCERVRRGGWEELAHGTG